MTANDPDSDSDSEPEDPDRNRYTATRRGPSDGEWLEAHTEDAFERWEYRTRRHAQIYCREADLTAVRRTPVGDPSDYLVIECKDWADRPITEPVIDRLVMLAFTARAMPVLVTTTDLTNRAWQISQAWDVRILGLSDLQAESLPDLPLWRVPPDAESNDDKLTVDRLRANIPRELKRDGPDGVEAPVFDAGSYAPAYLPDRTNHNDYTHHPDP